MGFAEQKIAIIGGGLGGMSFINAALHAGLTNVDIYERAAEFTEVGAGINITRNANRILDSYGLKESMLKKSNYDLPCYMEYRHYRTGEYLGHVDESEQPTSRLLHRAHFLESLKDRVPESKLHLDKQLTGITKTSEDKGGSDRARAYRLHFHDGTHADADIVVGCDGIKSAVREYLNITEHPDYAGQMVYRGFVSYDDLPSDTAQLLRGTTNFRGPQRHILVLPIGNSKSHTDQAAIIGFMSESLENWTSENWMSRSKIEDLHNHVKDWCPAVQDIIAALHKSSPDGRIMKQALYVRKPIDKWYEMNDGSTTSGVILLGDSAHSTLPHQGQGSCMAIESGIALATILRYWKSNDLATAFEFYKRLRKPRTDRITDTSYQVGKLASSQDPDAIDDSFNPGAMRERMRWIMEYDVLDDLWSRNESLLSMEKL